MRCLWHPDPPSCPPNWGWRKAQGYFCPVKFRIQGNWSRFREGCFLQSLTHRIQIADCWKCIVLAMSKRWLLNTAGMQTVTGIGCSHKHFLQKYDKLLPIFKKLSTPCENRRKFWDNSSKNLSGRLTTPPAWEWLHCSRLALRNTEQNHTTCPTSPTSQAKVNKQVPTTCRPAGEWKLLLWFWCPQTCCLCRN